MPQTVFTREHKGKGKGKGEGEGKGKGKGMDLHEWAKQGKALAYVALIWQAGRAGVLGLAQAGQNSIAKMAHLAAQKGTSPLHKHLDQVLHAHACM